MAIYNDSIEIFWDTFNGIYNPHEIENIFNKLKIKEVFEGSESYSPIKKNRYIFENIIKKL
jgi:hypothetical protein